jgi:hypothetical protein
MDSNFSMSTFNDLGLGLVDRGPAHGSPCTTKLYDR